MLRKLTTGIFVLCLAACGSNAAPPIVVSGDSASAASRLAGAVPKVAGTYKGTINDENLGKGTLQIVLSQNGSKLSGTFTPTWNHTPVTLNVAGKVAVKNGKTTVSYTLKRTGVCPGTSTGTISQTHKLDGTYLIPECHKGGGAKGSYQTKSS